MFLIWNNHFKKNKKEWSLSCHRSQRPERHLLHTGFTFALSFLGSLSPDFFGLWKSGSSSLSYSSPGDRKGLSDRVHSSAPMVSCKNPDGYHLKPVPDKNKQTYAGCVLGSENRIALITAGLLFAWGGNEASEFGFFLTKDKETSQGDALSLK